MGAHRVGPLPLSVVFRCISSGSNASSFNSQHLAINYFGTLMMQRLYIYIAVRQQDAIVSFWHVVTDLQIRIHSC